MTILIILATLLLIMGILSLLLFNPRVQLFGKVINSVPTQSKFVAITFDDGPNEPYTSEILKILDLYNAKATFFMVGVNCERFPRAVINVKKHGHEIGVHSYSHKFKSYFLDIFFTKEIASTQKVLEKFTVYPVLVRTPWLFKTPFINIGIKKLGFEYTIGGTFSHIKEPFNASPEAIARNVIDKASPGSIIIFHDGYNGNTADRSRTVKALGLALDKLSKKGYRFVSVSDLLKLKQ